MIIANPDETLDPRSSQPNQTYTHARVYPDPTYTRGPCNHNQTNAHHRVYYTHLPA